MPDLDIGGYEHPLERPLPEYREKLLRPSHYLRRHIAQHPGASLGALGSEVVVPSLTESIIPHTPPGKRKPKMSVLDLIPRMDTDLTTAVVNGQAIYLVPVEVRFAFEPDSLAGASVDSDLDAMLIFIAASLKRDLQAAILHGQGKREHEMLGLIAQMEDPVSRRAAAYGARSSVELAYSAATVLSNRGHTANAVAVAPSVKFAWFDQMHDAGIGGDLVVFGMEVVADANLADPTVVEGLEYRDWGIVGDFNEATRILVNGNVTVETEPLGPVEGSSWLTMRLWAGIWLSQLGGLHLLRARAPKLLSAASEEERT